MPLTTQCWKSGEVDDVSQVIDLLTMQSHDLTPKAVTEKEKKT